MKNYRDLSGASRFAIGLAVIVVAVGVASSIGSAVVSGGGSSFYTTFLNQGVSLVQRPAVNWLGGGVSCVDNPSTLRTDCTVSGGGGGGGGGSLFSGSLDPNGASTELLPTNMSSNSTPPPFVASAQFTFAGGFEPFNLFASNGPGSYWISQPSGSSATPTSVKIDLGSVAVSPAFTYTLQVNNIPEPTRAPNTWTLQGSLDDSAWTVLDTVSGSSGWSSAETRTFGIDLTTTAYRYYRLNFTANNGDASFYQLAKWRMFTSASSPVTGVPSGSFYIELPARRFYGPYDGAVTWPPIGTLNP
jgi:hypothetical protein